MSTDSPELDHFDHDDAWRLGSDLAIACRKDRLPVAICIHLGEQRVFHAGLPGSSADNDRWAERKSRIVRVRGALVGVLAVSGLDSHDDHDLAVTALRGLLGDGAQA